MSLKPQPDRPPVALPPAPAWGVLAEPGEPVAVVRFESSSGAFSYPYHTLSRWVLSGTDEELVIQAGRDTINVLGRQLAAVRDALDSGRLQVLRAKNERYVAGRPVSIVTQLSIFSPSPTDPDG